MARHPNSEPRVSADVAGRLNKTPYKVVDTAIQPRIQKLTIKSFQQREA